MSILFRAISFLMGSSTSQRGMNPLASGAFVTLEATVKCFERVWVVSPFIGIGGRTGLGLSPGAWPKEVLASTSNPDKTTKAIAGNRELFFLFIEDFFYRDYLFLKGASYYFVLLANNRQNYPPNVSLSGSSIEKPLISQLVPIPSVRTNVKITLIQR